MTQNINAPATGLDLPAGGLALLEMPNPETASRRIMWEIRSTPVRRGVVHDRELLGLLLRRIPAQCGVKFIVEGEPAGTPRAQLARDGDRHLVEVGHDWGAGLRAVTQVGHAARTVWLHVPWCVADVIPALDPVQIFRQEWAADVVWLWMTESQLPYHLGLIDVIPGPHRDYRPD